MSEEFLVPTGAIIKEYLEYDGMTQKEFSKRLGISEKHTSNLLNGKTRLTEELALKIENVLPPTPASYWLNYEAKYQEFVSRSQLSNKYDAQELDEIAKKFHFSEVFSGFQWDIRKQANEMLKILRIANYDNFDSVYGSSVKVDFMQDNGDQAAIAVWLGLAREEAELQNKKKMKTNKFKKEEFIKSLNTLKNISLNNDYRDSIKSARKLLNSLGVYLVLCDPIVNSKVRGALATYEGAPIIYLSGRFKTHDNIWFALLHEIGHLLLHYNSEDIIVTLEDEDEQHHQKKENDANVFARNFFIDENNYMEYLNKEEINEVSIKNFAASQNILPGIVVGRLQHDKIITYEMFNYLKDK